jgi:hypothetical protein
VSRLGGLDVIVIPNPDDDAPHRCLAQLAAQGRPPSSVTVFSDVSAELLRWPSTVELRVRRPEDAAHHLTTAPGTAGPWTLLLRSGDGLAEDALVHVEAATDGIEAGVAALLCCARSTTGSQGSLASCPPESTRLLVHRDWNGWYRLPALLSDWQPRELLEDTSVPSTAIAIAEAVLGPLGPDGPDPHVASWPAGFWLPPATAFDATIVGVGAPVHLPPQRLVHGEAVVGAEASDWAPADLLETARRATTPWIVFVDAGQADAIIDETFLAKCWMSAASGVRFTLLVGAAGSGARWRQVPLDVGSTLVIVGWCCMVTDQLEAQDLGEIPDVETLIERLLGIAAGSGPSAVRAHGFPVDLGSGTRVIARPLGPRSPRSRSRPAAPPQVGVGRWPTPTLELVGDPIDRTVALSSPWAPLARDRWPLRAPIGRVDVHPFAGTAPLCRRSAGDAGGPLGGFEYDCTNEGEVLGYVGRAPLPAGASLFDGWAGALAVLHRLYGFQPRWSPVPERIGDLYVAPPTSAAADQDVDLPTFIIDLPGDRVVASHADVVPAAALLGVAGRVGPAIARTAQIDRVPVEGLRGTVGFARASPAPSDVEVASSSGRWWGRRPSPDERLLVRWLSRGQHRCTTGGLPLLFRNGTLVPDRRAVLLGTLGWARAPRGGPYDLVELYHPGRGQWMVTADPTSAQSFGFVVVGAIASLEPEQSPLHVPVNVSYDRRTGSHRLHLVAAEASGPTGTLNGYVRLATVPPVSERPRSSESRSSGPPLDPRPAPGVPLVVAMAHRDHEPVLTTDPWQLVAEGWVCTEVVGYASEPVNEVALLVDRASRAVRTITEAGTADRLAGAAGRWLRRMAGTGSLPAPWGRARWR